MFERIDVGGAVIVIAPVEDESVYYPALTASDRDFMRRFSNPLRRASWAAWRAAARSVLGDAEIGYNDLGAPVILPDGEGQCHTAGGGDEIRRASDCRNELQNGLDRLPGGFSDGLPGAGFRDVRASLRYIGVSHSRNYAAVIVSPRPCAIDIEDAGRNFDRVSGKYISAAEAALAGSDSENFKAGVWCAKETLYKISGRAGLELTGDLRITSFDAEAGDIVGGIRSATGEWCDYRIKMLVYRECILTYLIDD